jgi:hypothetical protein
VFPTLLGVNFNQYDKKQHFIVMFTAGLIGMPLFGWYMLLLGQLPIFTKEIYDHFVKRDSWSENRDDIIAGELGLVPAMLLAWPFT